MTRKPTRPERQPFNEREERLICAITGMISHARAHLIDLGHGGDVLEDTLRIVTPGTMESLDALCPAPKLSLRERSELRAYGLRGLEKFQERQRRAAKRAA